MKISTTNTIAIKEYSIESIYDLTEDHFQSWVCLSALHLYKEFYGIAYETAHRLSTIIVVIRRAFQIKLPIFTFRQMILVNFFYKLVKLVANQEYKKKKISKMRDEEKRERGVFD